MINNTGYAYIGVGDFYYFYITNSVGYNNYQLIYDATAETASFWVDGVEKKSDITSAAQPTDIRWGQYNAYPEITQINWSWVSLEITPEPSSVALIFLGSGVLAYIRKARRRARAGQIKGQS
jgi:hypothetical protein